MAAEIVDQILNFTEGVNVKQQFDNLHTHHGTMGVGLALSLGAPLLAFGALYWFSHSLLSRKSESGLKVPRGNPLLLPLFGETFHMTLNQESFIKSRVKRYGELFTSHLFRAPTVVVTSADGLKQVMASPIHNSFSSTLPPSITKLLGAESIGQAPSGTAMHAQIRRMYLQRVKGENIEKASLMSDVDVHIKTCVESWAEKGTVEAYTELKKLIFRVALVLIFGENKPGQQETEIFDDHIKNIVIGTASIPLNIPGTTYYKAIQGLKAFHDFIDGIVEKREKETNDIVHDDLLADLMSFSAPEDGTKLTRSQIRDNALFAMIAAHHTSACAFTWLLKFVAENPEDLQEIIAEHKAIAASKDSKDYSLTYEDISQAPASLRAFLETSRLVNPTFGVLRTATEDTEVAGQLIPKGWSVLLAFRPTHYNSKYYTDPSKFNPSRFRESPPQAAKFLPFGNGVRICPGIGLAKTEAVMLLHRLLLGYRYELVGNTDRDCWYPVPVPKGGLTIKVTRIQE